MRYDKIKDEKEYKIKNRERAAKYNKQHNEEKKEYLKEYCKKNKETLKLKNKQYRDENKEIIKERAKIRRKNNIKYKICHNLRSRLRNVVKKKSGHTMDLLGCDIDFFLQYLESKFQNGMTWANYGRTGWHIDHIRPCASFNLLNEDEQKSCFHYTNLQPLWAEDNLKKWSFYNE